MGDSFKPLDIYNKWSLVGFLQSYRLHCSWLNEMQTVLNANSPSQKDVLEKNLKLLSNILCKCQDSEL